MRGLGILRPRGGEPVSAIASAAGSVSNRARGGISNLRVLAAGAFGREAAGTLPCTSNDPAVQFRSACDLHDADPDEVQNATHRAFLLYLALAAGLFAVDVATWRSYAASWLQIVGHASPILPALALAIRAAFGNWQVRHGRLDGITVYLRTPAEWWSEPAMSSAGPGGGGTAAAIVLAGIGAAGAIIGTAPAANAADTATGTGAVASLFTALPSTDLWGKLLSFVFPGVGPISGQISPIAAGIADSFSSLLALLMAVAAVGLAGQTVVAAVETAHTGTVLGRWHRTWAPIRVCYGFASLAPVVKGYCLLQILVIWIAVASGQVGNVMWSAFVGGLTTPSPIAAPQLPESVPFVHALLRTEVCAAEEAQIATSYGTPAPTWPATYAVGSTVGTVASGSWSWVASWWSSSPSDTSPITLQRVVWDYGACGQVATTSSPGASGGLGVLNTAQLSAVDTLRAALRTQATAIVATTQAGTAGTEVSSLADVFASVVTAKNKFDASLQAATTAFVSSQGQTSFSDFQSAATAAGWVAAGPYYMSLARINASTVDAGSAVPDVDATSYAANRIRGPLRDALYAGDAPVMATVDDWWDRSISTPSAVGLSTSAAAAGTLRQGGIRGALGGALSSSSWLQKHALAAVTLDPAQFDGLQQMVNEGDYIVGIGEALVGADLLKRIAPYLAGPEAVAAKRATDAVTGGGGSLSWSDLVTGGVGLSLLVAGLYESLVLPMLPAIYFIFAVLGMLFLTIEGVCAAPLWALAHCRMDGEGAIGPAQRAGYIVLMNLAFRIPLTLLGLLFSLLAFDAAVWLLNVCLAPAMAAATTESLFGLLSTIVYMLMTGVLSYAAAGRCFSLITSTPDRVLRWLGASDGGADEGHHATAAVAVVRQSMGGASLPSLGGKRSAVGRPISGVPAGTENKESGGGEPNSIKPMPAPG